MSKKKDREDTNYRNCPVCGSKSIFVCIRGKFRKFTYIHCCKCDKDTMVKEFYRKENFDYLQIQNLYKRNYRKRVCRK